MAMQEPDDVELGHDRGDCQLSFIAINVEGLGFRVHGLAFLSLSLKVFSCDGQNLSAEGARA